MTSEQYSQFLQQGYNRIPLLRRVLADLDTPLTAYLKLADQAYSYLFESIQGGETWGRYSIIGLPAKTVIKIYGFEVKIFQDGELIESLQVADPLEWIKNLQQSYKVPKYFATPPFTGGLVGYFGYDTVRYIEPHLLKSQPKHDPLGNPDILLMVSDEVVVFDNLKGEIFLVVHAENSKPGLAIAEQRLDELISMLKTPVIYPPQQINAAVVDADFKTGFGYEAFKQAVESTKDYILDGDIMQAVLSQRLSVPCQIPPLHIYRALRYLNPSPYMFYLHLNDTYVVGSSPEILVRLQQNEVTVRPIAGTRPRGTTPEEDKLLEQDLLSDPKELAEHLMLIDLGRNDVGRVASLGSVKLTEQMIIERYSHVMHIVSNVTGKLKPQLGAIDVLRATFPAGTLSGAPKIRAMEIIDEFEPVKRGIYGGAVGYIAWNGDMDTAIAIRTAVIKNQILHLQVGAGIVTDSIPENEWQETMNKGKAMFKAVAMAANALQTTV
jgi:anthranilate synthase component I